METKSSVDGHSISLGGLAATMVMVTITKSPSGPNNITSHVRCRDCTLQWLS